MNSLSIVVAIAIVAALTPEFAHARAFMSSRQKRVSDQRVAELETLLALARMRGKLVTVPVGFGRVDPARIGRKRRSSDNEGLERLRSLLQMVGRDSESISAEDSDDALPHFRKDAEERNSLELTDRLA